MGCIEINERNKDRKQQSSLIETWDVLKCKFFTELRGITTFNRNMGCIEI